MMEKVVFGWVEAPTAFIKSITMGNYCERFQPLLMA